MKLLCKIGTQGLSDGRRIKGGETYEVDDVTASTLVAAGYAEVVEAESVSDVVEETVVVAVPDSLDTTIEAHTVVEPVDIIEPPAPDADDAIVIEPVDITNDPVSEPDDVTDEVSASVADDAMKMAESVAEEPAPDPKKKRTYRRRK